MFQVSVFFEDNTDDVIQVGDWDQALDVAAGELANEWVHDVWILDGDGRIFGGRDGELIAA